VLRLELQVVLGVGEVDNSQELEVEVGEPVTLEEVGVALDHWRIQMIG
jgi:hypothetical protein